MEVNEKAMRQLFILNSGKFNFDFTWELNSTALARPGVLSVDKMTGGVMAGETTQCALAFCPPMRMSMRGYELSLKVGVAFVQNVYIQNFIQQNDWECNFHRDYFDVLRSNLRIVQNV